MSTSGSRQPSPPHPLTSEAIMLKMERLMDGKDFQSAEELNAFFQNVVGQRPIDDLVPDTPQDEALELAGQALMANDPQESIDLAQRALELDSGCLDAYRVLARHEEDPTKALDLLEQGAKIGEEQLGPETLEDQSGELWHNVRARPYLRIRWDLADMLWAEDRHEQAFRHAEELLRLSEDDVLQVRHTLIHWYLQLGKLVEAKDLLKRFESDTYFIWLYAKALHLFLRDGESERSNRAFDRAFEANPYLIDSFLPDDRRVIPSEDAEGLTQMADDWVLTALPAWAANDGALEWFVGQVKRNLRVLSAGSKVGRNDPCPCGSGKKYKKCCGA